MSLTYRIAGNFQGRKLRENAENEDFVASYYRPDTGSTHAIFMKITFKNAPRSVKLFSLKSFPLYGICPSLGKCMVYDTYLAPTSMLYSCY